MPPYEDYALKGRTYRYLEKEPLFPFGFGLSYTQFEYSDLQISRDKLRKRKKNATIEVSATLTNTGKYDAAEVVQLYIADEQASVDVPKYSLKDFQRVDLKAGASKKIKFTITPEQLMLVNNNGESVLEKGEFKIYVGGSVPSQRSVDLGAAAFLSGEVTVR